MTRILAFSDAAKKVVKIAVGINVGGAVAGATVGGALGSVDGLVSGMQEMEKMSNKHSGKYVPNASAFDKASVIVKHVYEKSKTGAKVGAMSSTLAMWPSLLDHEEDISKRRINFGSKS